MAVNRNYQIPQASQAIAVLRTPGEEGETINVFATREMYRWMSLIEKLLKVNGPLAVAEDGTVDNSGDIAQNESDITDNSTDILDINLNHVLQDTAHNSNGDVVGKLDLASIPVAGLVKKAVDPGDSVAVLLATLVADYNTLLANLRTAGIL